MSIAVEHPCINSKDTHEKDNPLLEYENGHLIGKHPLSADINLLRNAGHEELPIAKVIRKKCLDCCVFQAAEVRRCVCTDCALWPYRMGKNPFISARCKNVSMQSNFKKREG